MYNLFLDDCRNPLCLGLLLHFEVVRNYDQFVKIITERGLPDFISFDHDLCWEDNNKNNNEVFKEKTGFDCAKWLVWYCIEKHLPLPKYQCHSLNIFGKKNILDLLKYYENRFR